MPQLSIDPMNNAANWKALAPDGVTPSTEIAVANETTQVRFGADRTSGRLTASTNALNHALTRSLSGLDLTQFDDIRLWFRSSRPGDGSPSAPFYLEIRLASAAMELANPGNTWRRFVPAFQADTWDLVRLSLDDLPAAVRSAVNLIQIRCAEASTSFVCAVDDIVAVREEMIGDVDAALLALLHNQVSLGGNAVPAVLIHPEKQAALPTPSIRITHYDIRYAGERTTFNRARGDYAGTGFRLRPLCVHYDLYYIIDAFADTRRDKTQLFEFVLRTLSPRTELLINNMHLPLLWESVAPLDETGNWRSDRPLLYFRIETRQEVGTFEQVKPPYASISVVSDQKTGA